MSSREKISPIGACHFGSLTFVVQLRTQGLKSMQPGEVIVHVHSTFSINPATTLGIQISMSRLRRLGKDAPDLQATPDHSAAPGAGEGVSTRQKDAQMEALGAFKTCLDIASTILSALPIQAPKAAVDTIKQLVTSFEVSRAPNLWLSPTSILIDSFRPLIVTKWMK